MLPRIFNPTGELARIQPSIPESPSSYDLTLANGTTSHFYRGRELGRGTFGIVYLLRDVNTQDAIVVKHIEDKKNPYLEHEVDREIAFYKAVFPGIAIKKFKIEPLADKLNPRFRIVMPRFARYRFLDAMRKSEINTIDLILDSAQELQRIHNLGVLHGDITRKNVLVNENGKTFYIDYNWAYLITDQHAQVTEEQKIVHFPPERKIRPGDILPKPHPAQDIYSYAYMIFEALTHLPSFDLPPEIFIWLYWSLSDTASQRKSLADLTTLIENVKLSSFKRTEWSMIIAREDLLSSQASTNMHQRFLLAYFLATQLIKDEKNQGKSLAELSSELAKINHRDNISQYFDLVTMNKKQETTAFSTSKEMSTSHTNESASICTSSISSGTSQFCPPKFSGNAADLRARLSFNPFKTPK